MENQNKNDIIIPYSELDDAVENIIYDEYPEYYETMNRDSVKEVLKEHLEYAIEEIISEPLKYFWNNKKFWRDMRNSVYLEDDI